MRSAIAVSDVMTVVSLAMMTYPPFVRLLPTYCFLASFHLATPAGRGSQYWRCDADADENTSRLAVRRG